jgi:hypothetical protein
MAKAHRQTRLLTDVAGGDASGGRAIDASGDRVSGRHDPSGRGGPPLPAFDVFQIREAFGARFSLNTDGVEHHRDHAITGDSDHNID